MIKHGKKDYFKDKFSRREDKEDKIPTPLPRQTTQTTPRHQPAQAPRHQPAQAPRLQDKHQDHQPSKFSLNYYKM